MSTAEQRHSPPGTRARRWATCTTYASARGRARATAREARLFRETGKLDPRLTAEAEQRVARALKSVGFWRLLSRLFALGATRAQIDAAVSESQAGIEITLRRMERELRAARAS